MTIGGRGGARCRVRVQDARKDFTHSARSTASVSACGPLRRLDGRDHTWLDFVDVMVNRETHVSQQQMQSFRASFSCGMEASRRPVLGAHRVGGGERSEDGTAVDSADPRRC